MRRTFRVLVLAVSTILMDSEYAASQSQDPPAPAHVRSAFQFKLSVPLERAAPLFGPEGERCWAGEQWNPDFIYPQPATDIEGAVFKVQHGPHQSIWVNTLFNLSAGHMQYVSLIPDVVVSIVDVRLTALDYATTTGVQVTYTRTALSSAVNDHVQALAAGDRTSGPHWQQAIQNCLAKQTR